MSSDPAPPALLVPLVVDGVAVEVPDDGGTLLGALRDRLGVRSAKDGCSPQGQCGCCTVLVDGAPRVSCVTPLRRVSGRTITTIDGLTDDQRTMWSEAFVSTGASQCGFCTPGIVCRLEALRSKGVAPDDAGAVDRALAAHLCRCTGWQTIHEAWALVDAGGAATAGALEGVRDHDAAERRAGIEGGVAQHVARDVALGRSGFADDDAPRDALVAVPDGEGGWAVGETLAEARTRAGKIQGRRGTVESSPPIELPDGDWDLTLRTSWVEPAYLETDASWCVPGGEPVSPLANGGAFGGKVDSVVGDVARRLADEHGRVVRVLLSREDTVRMGPKRPPIAAGVRADGTGVVRVARTPGIDHAIHAAAPRFVVEEVDVPGPATSAALRAAGTAEALVLLAALTLRGALAGGSFDHSSHHVSIDAPNGSSASAALGLDGVIRVEVMCGRILDRAVLRSYVIGAVHMALGWVTSESLAVDSDGTISDLTIRSFGIVRPADMPHVEVTLHEVDTEPVNGTDAVYAAVAALVWSVQGWPTDWPTRRPLTP
jgi:xanthine dehydrogenase small subunit